MSEEATKNVMLYFYEALMKANHPLPLNHLVSHFNKRRFSNEMRIAVGGSEIGLKTLFLKFPSIFKINGYFVGLTDWNVDETEIPDDSSDSETSNKSIKKNTFIPNVTAEMEAVRFFQDKFVKRSSREMQVRSLAGHLSQASSSIRRVVGPQLQFKTWLKKHPHIFEVEGDVVKLQDDVAALILDVEMAESELICGNGVSSGATKSKAEIMAIVFLGDLIRQHQGLTVDNIDDHIRLAPTSVRNFINNSNIRNFIDENSMFFKLEDGVLSEVKSPCSNLVRANELDKVELTEEETKAGVIVGKGRIYHIAKLWGIIDLGQHDHVFFDRSILPKATLDMKKEFKVGQILCFKALPAPKTSRAKWKALSVWKASMSLLAGEIEEGAKVDEEIYRLVLADHKMVDELLDSDEESVWNNIETSNDGCAAPKSGIINKMNNAFLLNKNTNNHLDTNGNINSINKEDGNCQHTNNDLVVDTNSFLKNHTSKLIGSNVIKDVYNNNVKKSLLCSVSCQTESTGDIIATQLYNG